MIPSTPPVDRPSDRPPDGLPGPARVPTKGKRAKHSTHSTYGRGRRPEDRLSIRLLRLADVTLARLYHRTVVRAPLRLPRDGPAILVCNHISGLDPVLIQAVCPRLIVWMMAKEYYDIRAMRWFFTLVEAIPVGRGGRDLAATRAGLRALDDGRVLGVFPEGRIEKTRDLLPFHTGVAMMAIKSGAPVYPAHLEGTQRRVEMLPAFLHPNEAVLTFGPEVHFDRSGTSKQHLEAATEQIRLAVGRLRPDAGAPQREIWR